MSQVFEILNDQWFQVTITDGLAALGGGTAVIVDASVTAKLYKNRIVGNPAIPGTLVPTFGTAGTISLQYIGNSGKYRALITQDLNDTIGTNYVLVIDASTPGGADAHKELKAQLIVRQT